MEDAAMYYANVASAKSDLLATHNLVPNNYVLGTMHRAENTDNPENLKNLENPENHADVKCKE